MKDIDNKNAENRRSFLKNASLLIGAGLALPVMGSVITSCDKNESLPPAPPKEKVTIDLTKYATLAVVGGAAKVSIPKKNNGNPLIIVKTSATTFSVMDSACSHAGCPVELPTVDGNDMLCACHNVTFNKMDGSVLSNPISSSWPSVSLTTYVATYSGGTTLEIDI